MTIPCSWIGSRAAEVVGLAAPAALEQQNQTAIEIHITDEGPGFDPTSVPDCTTAENLERPCGRGLMLMRYYMNNVTFSATGNSVSMLKLRNGTK